MRIVDCDSYADLSARAAALVIAAVERKPDLLLCAATGDSPVGVYDALARKAAADPGLFSGLRVIKLDEWGGMSATTPGSCEHYLRTRLLDPLAIAPARYAGFDATAADPTAECARIRAVLDREGPIDLCVLGLGVNGHVGFNEPAPALYPHCHVASLTEETRRHTMVRSMEAPPTYGLTLGMREVLAARHIVLLVTGSGKREVATDLLSAQVTTALPASLLWLHGNTDCLVDRRTLEPATA